MRFLSLSTFAVALSLAGYAITPAQAQSCGELWVAINSIYKNNGYCFRTRRAIDHFGNAGCVTSDMREVRASMSGQDRRRVDRLVAMSRDLGCRD